MVGDGLCRDPSHWTESEGFKAEEEKEEADGQAREEGEDCKMEGFPGNGRGEGIPQVLTTCLQGCRRWAWGGPGSDERLKTGDAHQWCRCALGKGRRPGGPCKLDIREPARLAFVSATSEAICCVVRSFEEAPAGRRSAWKQLSRPCMRLCTNKTRSSRNDAPRPRQVLRRLEPCLELTRLGDWADMGCRATQDYRQGWQIRTDTITLPSDRQNRAGTSESGSHCRAICFWPSRLRCVCELAQPSFNV